MDRSTRIKRYHVPTLNDTETLADTVPFKIEWSYGWNLTMGLKIIVNDKSKKNQKKLQMFYASTHVGIISEYNIETKKTQMKILNGHNNFISSFDVSTNGRWLVTADNGHDSVLVVWEIAQGTPIFTAFLPPNVGVVAVKFSINSKYLVTVSSTLDSGAQSIGLWDWTSGAEEPKHSAQLGAETDPVLHIATCPNRSNFYCFTTKKMIVFLTVDKVDDKTVLAVHNPGLDPEQKEHQYTQSVYITNFRQVLSASTGGNVSVWDDYDYNSLEITETPIKNEKRLLKTVRLQNCAINTIICQKVIMTGNANGDIFFYDKTLRILYHLKKFVGDSIVSISMLTSIDKCTEIDTIEEPVQCVNSRKKKCAGPDNAKDFAIPNEPQLKFDSFVLSTGNGRIILVEVADQNFIQIQEPCDGSVTSSTVHPEQTFIVFGSSLGRLNMYNYHDKQFLISYVIASDHQPPSDSRYITNIEFSPKGKYYYFVNSHRRDCFRYRFLLVLRHGRRIFLVSQSLSVDTNHPGAVQIGQHRNQSHHF
ncbi:cilia- and flagella-associated protein 251-like [Adelges cooleyi]|uniref:cilia- and flagella-associated protein 251-like n=1 Tax=Adelges cooleyi TaxID=133065 RepID=UPI00217FD374|nr:cilia- and flagella-associated protein 251-like [Adelges cooleyi]